MKQHNRITYGQKRSCSQHQKLTNVSKDSKKDGWMTFTGEQAKDGNLLH